MPSVARLRIATHNFREPPQSLSTRAQLQCQQPTEAHNRRLMGTQRDNGERRLTRFAGRHRWARVGACVLAIHAADAMCQSTAAPNTDPMHSAVSKIREERSFHARHPAFARPIRVTFHGGYMAFDQGMRRT